ncbi:PH domain-containing protein [Nesterenkonia flava]|uniref:PH domain-containing protein n=1 Tax=Nesterenkonia flava TaxID=469799 RepID=A0ABU1FU56_9MICC|nr:PH domain-containing protein [Nesterenkonia flava]MDR5712195.1 PH domain-containing protein [Nesterenkonia flava]
MSSPHDDASPERTGPETVPAEAGPTPANEAWFDVSWHKVHPLSPLVRGWTIIVGLPAVVFGYNWEMWADIWQAWRSGELAENLQQNPTPYMIGGAIFALVVVLIFGGFVLSWWFTRYQITDEHVMVKSGIFVRQHRQARIDRVQAVDLRQPLLARFTRLAELKFEVAEGDGTAATLAFLKKSEAEELRNEIMDRAAGRTAAPTAETHDADTSPGSRPAPGSEGELSGGHEHSPEGAERGGLAPGGTPVRPGIHDRHITQVPVGRLIGSVIVGVGTLMLLGLLLGWAVVLGGIGLVVLAFTEEGFEELSGALSTVPFLIPVLIAGVFSYYNEFSSGFRFTATMTGAGLRLKYGLLETTTQTIPPGRVQAIQIQQPMLWRPFGWYRVIVNVAGYGETGRTTLLPVGRREDAMLMASEMFPDLQVENPEQLFLHGLQGSGTELGFSEVPARARVFDPLVRRRRGFFATPSTLMIRDGRLTRQLTMVPHERIQSASLEQGPLARSKRIATLLLHLPSGPITPRVKNQDIDAVRDLFEQEAAYAAVARRLSDRNQWMLPEELHEFEKMVEDVVQEQDEPGPQVGQSEPAETAEQAAPMAPSGPTAPGRPGTPQGSRVRQDPGGTGQL